MGFSIIFCSFFLKSKPNLKFVPGSSSLNISFTLFLFQNTAFFFLIKILRITFYNSFDRKKVKHNYDKRSNLFCIGENTVHKTNTVFSNTSDINVCIYLILTFHKMVIFKMLNNFPSDYSQCPI